MHVADGADADRVAERELVAPEVHQPPAHVDGLLHRHRALPGVPEAHRHVGPHPQPLGPRPLDDGAEHLDRLGDGAVEVLAGEGLGRAAEDRHRTDPGRERAVEAALVGHQHRTLPPKPLLAEQAEQLLGVGELGDPARVDERRGLEDARPGSGKPTDELGLDRGGHDGRLVLQAVARPDLVEVTDREGRIGLDLRQRESHPPILTRLPAGDAARAHLHTASLHASAAHPLASCAAAPTGSAGPARDDRP